jgi:methyl-accepting chemotaxis protein
MKLTVIRNLKIKTKLLTGLFILASLTAIIGFMAHQTTTTIKDQFATIVDVSTPRLISLLQLKASAAEVETSIANLGATKDSTAKEELLANLEALQNAQTEFAREAKSLPDKVENINTAVDKVSTGTTLLVSAIEQKTSSLAQAPLYQSLHKSVGDLVSKADQLIDNEIYQLRKSNTLADSNVARQLKINVAVQLAAFALVVIIGILTSRIVIRPLSRLKVAVNAIAKGHLGKDIPVNSTDEIGELTTAINKLRITVIFLLEDAKAMDQEAKLKNKS